MTDIPLTIMNEDFKNFNFQDFWDFFSSCKVYKLDYSILSNLMLLFFRINTFIL